MPSGGGGSQRVKGFCGCGADSRRGLENDNTEHDYGTVREGKVADLVILEANPLECIDHIDRIAYVIREGRIISSQEITAIKDAIRQANAEK